MESTNLLIGAVVIGLGALVQIAVGVKTLFGNKDYASKADLQRLEDKVEKVRTDVSEQTKDLNATLLSLTSAVSRLEQAVGSSLCSRCANLKILPGGQGNGPQF